MNGRLPEQLHLDAGDVDELESLGESITLRPVRTEGTLVKEDGVWVFFAGQPVSASLTNEIFESLRSERDLQNLITGE